MEAQQQSQMAARSAGARLSAQQHQDQQDGGQEKGMFGMNDLLEMSTSAGMFKAHESLTKGVAEAGGSIVGALPEGLTSSVSNMLVGGETKNMFGIEGPDVSPMASGDGLDGGEGLSEISSSHLAEEGAPGNELPEESFMDHNPGQETPSFDAEMSSAIGDHESFAHSASYAEDMHESRVQDHAPTTGLGQDHSEGFGID